MAYQREKAVAYANRWWNSYNPQFASFPKDDCTNYISQCLWAGGAPMRGMGNPATGWWYRFGKSPSWSYSWTMAHGLKNYLSTSKTGLRAIKVNSVYDLQIGDVICYDFDGDGHWQHNGIIVGHDATGTPLINTHTYNRAHHPWDLADSPAYTPQIQYAFFHIVV
jgi:hypothetical protein